MVTWTPVNSLRRVGIPIRAASRALVGRPDLDGDVATGPVVPTGQRQPAGCRPGRAWWALAGVAAGVVLSVVLQGIAYAIDPNSDALIILFGEIGLWAALAGTCRLASRRYGTGRMADDFGLRFRPSDVAAGRGWLPRLRDRGRPWSAACSPTPSFRGSNTGIIRTQKGNDAGLIVVAAIASVGAPIFEELFFRGFLRLTLETRIGWVGAVWAQAVCFGLAHFQPGQGLGAVSVIAATMAIGVVLGYLAHLHPAGWGPGWWPMECSTWW